MSLARWLLCTLCFFVDVHVRADNPACAKAPCIARAVSGPYQLKESRVVIATGGMAELRRGGELHLVRGRFLLAGPGDYSTPFARFSCRGECAALLDREPDAAELRNLKGEWHVERKGDPQAYAVPAAMSLKVRGVSLDDGRAEMEFPQSLAWIPTLRDWAGLYPAGKESFREEAEAFRATWREAVETASWLHQQAAGREIASAEAASRRELARRTSREREDAELRRLFREKNYLSP